ncbi:hypothetical protein [Yersinia phage vB_YenP_ISAO8]|uniref:Uncharacterized protein n=1 Tax=Yersinia phage vB_YenP_ISAO8 TaxID=1675027 RepID=A0A0H4TGY9_9CAUD|nr:hypothetical protein AVU16_gp11 [Yersinia phage vB_YenP_ISAO8]AKQ07670.1 hypothetical protein [Yersinia phage vB_YenP_ISAO8]UQT03813.1 recombination endonuclease VII [Serratia phage vB_SmaP-Kaonashi]
MINLITKLLAFAYRREAAKFDRVSAKLIRVGKEQAEEATKLARRAEKALAESKDCFREETHARDRAEYLRRRGQSVVEFFGGE